MICSPPPPPDVSDQDALYLYVLDSYSRTLSPLVFGHLLSFWPSDARFSGLHNGTFTIFSSDHCPFRFDDPHGKPTGVLEHGPSMEGETTDVTSAPDLLDLLNRKSGMFKYVPNGIPGVETRLPLLYTGGVHSGRITPQKFVELTSTNPAKLVRAHCLLLVLPRRLLISCPFFSMDYILEKGR